jgi:hypothetical protein
MAQGTQNPANGIITCVPVALPEEAQHRAAIDAIKRNPSNYAPVHNLKNLIPNIERVHAEAITALVGKHWGPQGVMLSVSFLDNPDAALRARLLSHMNAWAEFANVLFRETESRDGHVRVIRDGSGLPEGAGHWEYEGQDILQLDMNRPTMCLQNFTMAMPESEFRRVVRHEAGHALGFHHEHLRKELIEKISVEAAIEFYADTQGWNEVKTRIQVLTPIDEFSLRGSPWADPDSIMCYQIPSAITRDHVAIPGGADISLIDRQYAAQFYPKPGAPAQPQ